MSTVDNQNKWRPYLVIANPNFSNMCDRFFFNWRKVDFSSYNTDLRESVSVLKIKKITLKQLLKGQCSLFQDYRFQSKVSYHGLLLKYMRGIADLAISLQ